MSSLSIVVPCFNESGNVKLIIQGFISAIGDRENVEVILVNNGSTDDSARIFEKELNCINQKYFKVLTVSVNRGYGDGILKGLECASSDVLAWTHADMQTDPADVIKGFDLFEQNNKGSTILVKGKRLKRKPLEFVFSFGMQVIAWIFLGVYLDDINAQPKIFSRVFFEKYVKGVAPIDFSLDLFVLFTAKMNHLVILETPVIFGERRFGEAKGGGSWKTKIKLIRRTLNYILALRKSIKLYS